MKVEQRAEELVAPSGGGGCACYSSRRRPALIWQVESIKRELQTFKESRLTEAELYEDRMQARSAHACRSAHPGATTQRHLPRVQLPIAAHRNGAPQRRLSPVTSPTLG